MVKHNNQLPSVFLKKWWQRYVKTWFNQPGRKASRRISRQEKAKKLGVRPIGMLRPVVRPPTQRYNIKIRPGRGFTFDELKAAGVSRKAARSIGIAVDHRRKNRCTETLNSNSSRIKTYVSKLVLFPRSSKAKKGLEGIPADSSKSDIKGARSVRISCAVPIKRQSKKCKARAITAEDRKFRAYATLRKARRDAFNVGTFKKDQE